MSNYRPATDVWILARSKTKGYDGRGYYGGYPAGFLERARMFMGVGYDDRVLHVCGGCVRNYPYPRYAIGNNDLTVDMDPAVNPDFCCDVREPLPEAGTWDAIIADPPYTVQDAEHYSVGSEVLPSASKLVANCLAAVKPGGRVGILHYVWPRPPKGTRLVATVCVLVGFGNQGRLFTVFERAR